MVQPRGAPSSRVTRQRVTEIERRGFNMMTGEERRTVYIEPIEMPTDEPPRPDQPVGAPDRDTEPVPA
jgi:hypothetical protein